MGQHGFPLTLDAARASPQVVPDFKSPESDDLPAGRVQFQGPPYVIAFPAPPGIPVIFPVNFYVEAAFGMRFVTEGKIQSPVADRNLRQGMKSEPFQSFGKQFLIGGFVGIPHGLPLWARVEFLRVSEECYMGDAAIRCPFPVSHDVEYSSGAAYGDIEKIGILAEEFQSPVSQPVPRAEAEDYDIAFSALEAVGCVREKAGIP